MSVYQRGYVNITEAAGHLGVSRVTIWRWIRDGRLPVARLGHRTIRIKREDLDQLLEQAKASSSRSPLTPVQPAFVRAEEWQEPDAGWTEPPADGHVVQFYETDAFLLEAIQGYVGTAIRTGDAAVVIATRAHREGLEARLQAGGLDVATARACGQYVPLDVVETLARFMVGGMPDPARFEDVIGGTIALAAAGGRRVRLFGEMVALLAIEGNDAAVIRLEEMWNHLLKTRDCSRLCAYPMASLAGEEQVGLFGAVCAAHAQVSLGESQAMIANADNRPLAVLAEPRERQTQGPGEREQIVQALQAVAGQAEHLAHLIDQLLTGSSLDGDEQTMVRQAMTFPVPVSVGTTIPPVRLKEVLSGLLDNAVKYGPDGVPIDVVVSLAAPEVVELSIPDRGLELTPGQRIQNLERFYRDHGDSRKTGIGLGQFISRQIAELHGGEIRAEFPPDGGTRFVVRLPTWPVRPPAPVDRSMMSDE